MTVLDFFMENPHLQREWAWDQNAEYPEKGPLPVRAKVWWQCGRGHMWQATPDSRVYMGRSCPVCANQAVEPGENDIAALAPDMAKLWHPTRNGDLRPTDITPGSARRVWWQCSRGHSWQAAAYSLKAGTACPYCSGKRAIPGETDLATTHPRLLPLWSVKNSCTPVEVTAGSHRKVWWRCGQGHEWEASVGSVALEGCGCPYCAGKLAIPGQTDLATVRPELMAQWDPEKNRGTDPRQLLPSSHDRVWWRCEQGHSWQAMVFARTREKSSGCPYCTGRKVLPGFNDLQTLKPKLAEQWHPDLNGGLSPRDVTLGSNKRVWWQCRDGHVWQTPVYSRTRKKGTGCPVCAGTVRRKK